MIVVHCAGTAYQVVEHGIRVYEADILGETPAFPIIPGWNRPKAVVYRPTYEVSGD